MLNREAILNTATGRKTMVLDVKPWGDKVTIRGLSAGELDHVESMISAYDKDPMSITTKLRATVCAYLLSDASGNRLFSDADVDALDQLPAAGLTVVFNKGLEFNKRLAKAADAEKNSGTTPNESSGAS